MSTFPTLLRERLCEESHLRLAKATVDEQVRKLEAEHKDRQEGQTAVDFLLAAAKRPRPATVELNAVADQLASFRATQKVIDDIAAQLSTEIEELAECYVFESSEAYARGKKAFHNIEAWIAGTDPFESLLTAFLKELGRARPLASANYDHERKQMSMGAQVAIKRAIDAAIPLQQQVNLLNELAEAHDSQVRGTPAAGAAFPRVPVGDYTQWTQRLIDTPPLKMPAEFDRIIGLCETLLKFGVPQLRAAKDEVPAAGQRLNKAYLHSYLGTLREFSYKNWYNPQDSEARIAELERRYRHTAKANAPLEALPAVDALPSAP